MDEGNEVSQEVTEEKELNVFGQLIEGSVFPDQSLRQRTFLVAYSECGSLNKSYEITGISSTSHYHWMHTDSNYVQAFTEARRITGHKLEAEAIRRAYEGWDEPVYQGGKLAGVTRKYSDTLMIFMLKGLLPDIHREKFVELNNSGPLQINIGGGSTLPDGV